MLFILLPGVLATGVATFLVSLTDPPKWLFVIVGGAPLGLALALLEMQDEKRKDAPAQQVE